MLAKSALSSGSLSGPVIRAFFAQGARGRQIIYGPRQGVSVARGLSGIAKAGISPFGDGSMVSFNGQSGGVLHDVGDNLFARHLHTLNAQNNRTIFAVKEDRTTNGDKS